MLWFFSGNGSFVLFSINKKGGGDFNVKEIGNVFARCFGKSNVRSDVCGWYGF